MDTFRSRHTVKESYKTRPFGIDFHHENRWSRTILDSRARSREYSSCMLVVSHTFIYGCIPRIVLPWTTIVGPIWSAWNLNNRLNNIVLKPRLRSMAHRVNASSFETRGDLVSTGSILFPFFFVSAPWCTLILRGCKQPKFQNIVVIFFLLRKERRKDSVTIAESKSEIRKPFKCAFYLYLALRLYNYPKFV